MNVVVINKQKDLSIKSKELKPLVAEVIRFEKKDCDELTVHLTDQSTICKLHAKYFQDPSPTDCISFPLDDGDMKEGYRILGDIFVCPKTAIDYAAKSGKDPYQEVMLYIVHGLLHLMGYDDLAPEDRKKMRAAEKRHMSHLKACGISLT